MRAQDLGRGAIVAALVTLASTGLASAADNTSSANHAVSTRPASAEVRSVAKAYRVSAASVATTAPRRCTTIACPGYLIVGIAY